MKTLVLKVKGLTDEQIQEEFTEFFNKLVEKYPKQFGVGLSVMEENTEGEQLAEILEIEAKVVQPTERHHRASQFIDSQESNRKKVGFTIENMYEEYKSIEGEKPYSRPQFYRIVQDKWAKEWEILQIVAEVQLRVHMDIYGNIKLV